MYLKKMEIKGFKSFPDKTEILFPHGLISVVGPNGSGKSNILDAIRWVLGEQSMKSLRGDKLEDVIFSGTEKRKEMNYCEVSLLIDNQDKMIDIDYSEIIIKRKAFKSGESQFFLNNKQCRLKDIKELLLDTGIGREGYSIISQGKIDEIVNGNSNQRRKILEEAAGITKFRYKKEESEKKLDVANENLERIHDVYKEVEKQILPLEIQKTKAEKYLLLKEELLASDVNRLLSSYFSMDSDLEKINSLILETDKNNAKLSEQLVSEETELNELENKLKELEQDKQILSNENTELERKMNEYVRNKDVDSQKIINLDENLEKSYSQKEKIIFEINSNKVNLDSIQKTHEDLLKQKKILEDSHSNKREKYETLEIELKKYDEEIENNRNKILELMNEQSRLISRNEILSENINDLEKKMSSWQNDHQNILNQIEEVQKSIIENETKIKLTVNQIEKLDEEKSLLSLRVTENTNKIEALKSQNNKNNIDISECSSKVGLLKKMEADNEGLSKGVKEVILNRNLNGICGAVANLITVKPGYEKALEAALGSQMQNIIIKTSNDAKKCIEFLKEKKLGRVTFLPIDSISGKVLSYSDEGILALDAIKYKDEYKDIAAYLLGRTVIVEDIDKALEISKKYKNSFRIVTKDGDIFNAGGSITGGSIFTSNSIFTRRKQISELEEMLKGLELKRCDIELEIKELIGVNEDLLLELSNKEKEYKNSSDVKMDLLQNHKTNVIQMEHLESKSKNSISDSDLISKSLEDAKITYNREKNEVEEYEKTINSLKLLTNDLINKKNSISKVFSEEDSELRSLDMENVRLNELLNSKQRELDSLNSLIEKNSKLLNDLESEIAFNEKLKNQMIDDNTSLDVEVNKLSEQIVIVKDKIYVCSNQEDTVKKALAQKREDYRNLEKDLISLQAKISKLDSDKAKIDFQKNSIIEKIRDDYSMELDDAIKLLDETIDTSKTKIDNLKKSIQDLGNINVDAIEQYNVIKERYDFYKEQKEDLEDSIKQINQIIISLEQNMVVEFEKSFCEINSKFDEVFKILFGGGSGKLILTDESNMLASDIDINVQPPGKKVKSISVLSGGEKALSAIAILFSILMRKPVPFCVLDEIDAPLDDANIIRFITLLNILSKQTQFITITHRRGTMEASEYIYGVTMQDKGVSKIISLKLEEAKEYIEN